MLPGGAQLSIDDPQAQFDVAASALDWLGLSDYARGFSGRSVFRRYATPRELVFGNTYFNRVGGLRADGQLVLCGEDLQRCVHATTDDQRLLKAASSRSLPPLPTTSPSCAARWTRACAFPDPSRSRVGIRCRMPRVAFA